MSIFLQHKRLPVIITVIVICIVVFTTCIDKKTDEINAERKVTFEQFAGADKCAGCHKDIYEKHLHNSHFLTSQKAGEKYIRGSFEKGKNSYAYDSHVVVGLEKRDSGLFQVVYVDGKEQFAAKFDISFGSGNKRTDISLLAGE